ncbi:hypothetical protein PV325_014143, partial [Microctonus aethiopoides]
MNDLAVQVSVPFPSSREAEIAYQVLRVDSEPKRSGVIKSLLVDENILNVSISGKEARKVRVSLTSFFDSLTLVTETMKEFDSREPKNKMMAKHTPAPYRPRSVYGYALYIGSNMVFFLYLVWAVVPDQFLHEKLGLTYWPLKYWAIALPIWVLTAVATFIFVIYPAMNMVMTPDIDDMRTIKDEYSLVQNGYVPGGIPPVSDIPIADVCRKLYLKPHIN